MLVANTDYGVGIILPGANFAGPIIAPTDGEMTWKNFDREDSAWLNLVPPGVLDETLFGNSEVEEGLSVVTLWRDEWNPAQADLLRWMVEQKFPAGTRFVWVIPEGSRMEVALHEAWDAFCCTRTEWYC